MTQLPLDLVAEILCRLPVKFLQQFRCVCKSWNSLISNDLEFAKKHLRMSINRRRLFIITSTGMTLNDFNVMSYPIHDCLPLDSICTSNPTQLECSSNFSNFFIGSCDGLFCFKINAGLAIICNPSIRKSKELPFLDIPYKYGRSSFSFGYDPFIHNYKVVSVFYDHVVSDGISISKSQVNVYTLGTHSWRKIQDFPSMMVPCGEPCAEPGIIVSGTVNWFAYSNESRVIVSLDLGKESYQEILQPDYEMSGRLTMGILRDCLCIVSHSRSSSDIWLMKEYGNKESWMKLIRLPNFRDNGFFHDPKIVHISEDGNQVLLLFINLVELNWIVYDSKNDTIRIIKALDGGWAHSNIYVESLLSP